MPNLFSSLVMIGILCCAGCGGSGGGDSSTPSTPPSPPPAVTITNTDIAGSWDITLDGDSIVYARAVFDDSLNMLSCTDATFHAGGYLIQTSIPYPPATYSAKILIQNDWIEPNPLQIFTSTIYTGYLTTDKLTWLGTYTSTRLNNGATVGTQTGTFRATKVPAGPG